MEGQGVIVGCDQNQEWLLPWWWGHYSKHNSYPVAFVDFGMSERAAAWCRSKGQLISLSVQKVDLKSVSSEDKCWEEHANLRAIWFTKPFACLESPFPLSCWIDLDCEIRGSMAFLFYSIFLGAEFALAKDVVEGLRGHTPLLPKETIYNAGVMAFRQNTEVLHNWAKTSLDLNNRFLSDQDALSWLIAKNKCFVTTLPSIYNWHAGLPSNPNAVIIHYAGKYKSEIQVNTAFN